MQRRVSLRRKSSKRAKLDRKANPWREAFVRTVGLCELCNRDLSYELHCHEIASGTASKRKALMAPCAILVLCNQMHMHNRPSCHSIVQVWPRAKQLALLYLRRGGDYDLAKFHEIVAMHDPCQADVDGWVDVLTRIGKAVSAVG
jgi:hypothetical protein